MKVCHFIASKGLGRGEAYIDLVNALCAHIEIVLLVPKGSLFLGRVDDRVRVVEYRSKDSRSNLFLLYEIYLQIKKNQPDIVHTHFGKATQIYYRINKFLKLPHVATKHNPRKGKIFNRLNNVIAVSEGVKQSIDHQDVTVIYNGISVRAINEVTSVAEDKAFKICAVGRLDKIKGFDLLIKEVARLDFEFELKIVGEGDERKNLQELINELNIGDKVKLLGFRMDIPELLSGADLQVMSSRSEGFSLAMVEAVFYSKVLISTNVGGSNEILSPGLIISEFEIYEKVKDVYNNYKLYLDEFTFIKNKYKDHLNITTCAHAHFLYYEEILTGTQGAVS